MTESPVELRLLTYNVHGLRAGAKTVGAIIRAARPDVVVIQEAPRVIRWRTRCAELARHAGLVVVNGGAPAAGNLVLSTVRVAVHSSQSVMLSGTPKQPRRGAVTALLSLGGVTFGVVGVHAGLRAPERARHAAEIVTLAARLREGGAGTVIVAGDLNAGPGSAAFAPLAAGYRDAWADAALGNEITYPALKARIDVVLVDPAVEVVSCGVPALGIDPAALARASDHLPVLAVLRVRSSVAPG